MKHDKFLLFLIISLICLAAHRNTDAEWKGSFSVGANAQSGNTDRLALSVDGNLERESKHHRLGGKFLFNYAEESEDVTARNIFVSGKYDYLISTRWYAFLSEELLKDKFRDLKLRSLTGVGFGYRIINQKNHKLECELGLGYLSEDFIAVSDDDQVTGRLAGKYEKLFLEKIQLREHLVFFPGIEEDRIQFRNEFSISTAILEDWALKISSVVEYDDKPPSGVDTTDITWIVGLQYNI